ncbi:MAG: 30S ribosomal protein S12 methylthiotransferase RimO [Candidatus Latescibacterota bacterium]
MIGMKACVVTMGCPKNTVDSEAAITILEQAGCTMTADPRAADVVFVNSCSFLDAAWQETVEETRRISSLLQADCGKKLVLMGCLPVHRQIDLETTLPWVDHFLPSGAHAEIPRLLEQVQPGIEQGDKLIHAKRRDPFAGYENRRLLTPGHTAYVKVAEGCDRRCTFCAIPVIRGPLVCRSPSSILREVDVLLSKGVKEITLLAQDILAYHSQGKRLPDLVDDIAASGMNWIRIFYMHPASLTMDIIRRLFANRSVCRYLEMPVQHASNALLARMGRSHNVERLERLISALRKEYPDAVVRSEAIVGFPGETEEDFDKLKEFALFARFASLGVFPYSSEAGTEAASAKDTVPRDIIAQRVAELGEVQEAISFDFHSKYIGTSLRVLVDRELEAEEGIFAGSRYAGRFYGQAYEIDGEVYLAAPQAPVGDWVTARIVDSDIYDLNGEIE